MVFQQIDTIVAFAMIMLLLSLVITAVVQVVVSVLGLRGRNLLRAVSRLVQEADPNLEGEAEELAGRVLSHPAVATSTNRLLWLVDRLRRKLGRPPLFNDGKRPPTEIRQREVVMILEPVLSSRGPRYLRHFEAGVGKWFETVMDAASEKFKLWSRWITIAGAVALGFGFQVDSLGIFTKLSRDPEARSAVLAKVDETNLAKLYTAATKVAEKEHTGAAEKPKAEGSAESTEVVADRPAEGEGAGTPQGAAAVPAGAEGKPPAAGTTGKGEGAEQGEKELTEAREALDLVLDQVYETKVLDLQPPASLGDLFKNPGGKLLTVLLLSLGAPFWYGTLKNLISLRSVVARKSDERQAG